MTESRTAERPAYPTWIRSSRTVVFWLVAAGIVVVGAVVALFWLPGLAFALIAIPFLYIAVVLTLTSHRLGPRGGDFQSRIQQSRQGLEECLVAEASPEIEKKDKAIAEATEQFHTLSRNAPA